MFALLIKGLQDFRGSSKQHLTFAFLFMVCTSLIMVPIISFIFNRMLLMMGSSSLLNADVYTIGFTYTGLIGMFIIGFLIVMVLFIEFGVSIIIAHKKYFNKDILISEAFMTTLGKTPALLGFGIFPLMLFLFLILPFIDSPFSTALIDLNIPIFIMSRLHSSHLSLLIYVCLLLCALYLIVRWIFTLHYIILEGKSVWAAIKSSVQITKRNRLNILFSLLLLNMAVFSAGFITMTLISLIPSMIEANIIGYLIEDYLITFSSFLTILFALLFIPINIIIITRLFYRFHKNKGLEVQDRLRTYTSKKIGALEQTSFRFFQTRKYFLLSILMIYLTGAFFLNGNINDNIVYLQWNVSVAAHRGDGHSAPENSMSSIRSAIQKEVDVVEIDVQLTKDGVVVLHHDQDLSRMAGVPYRITELTYEDVSHIDIGYLFSNDFRGTRIPTLDAVLELAKREDVKLIIDVKPYDDTGEELANAIVQLIERYEMEEQCYIQAFDSSVLTTVRQLNSDIKIGQVMYLAAGDLSGLDVDFYTINQSMLSDRFIQNARRNDREVWVWTVNAERNIREVLKYDIDGIITDYPERVQQMVEIDI